MIKGMTGFGQSQIKLDGIKLGVEIKSVNHRYLDLSLYLPPGFAALEGKIRQMVEKRLERGRVIVAVKLSEKVDSISSINKEAVKGYLKTAESLTKQFGLKNDLAVSDILKLPGIFIEKEERFTPELLWPALEKAILQALDGLAVMRQREGNSLAKDIGGHLKQMAAQIKDIVKRSNVLLKEKKKALPAEEFKAYQKSVDVAEELARLSHYIDEMSLLMKSNVSIGKKLDFVAQEMQRESNTIGSKLLDRLVSSSVITLKSKIEKIREQAQNIE